MSGGGLFGNTQQTGGGLFGNTQQSGGGLFGSTQPAGQTGGGLFGTTQPAQQTGGGLFGNTQQTGGGLFGSAQPATGGLFGAQQPAAAAGAQQQQQQQQPRMIDGKVKVSELPAEMQMFIKDIIGLKMTAERKKIEVKEFEELEKTGDLAKTLKDISSVQKDPVASILEQVKLMHTVAENLQSKKVDKSFYEFIKDLTEKAEIKMVLLKEKIDKIDRSISSLEEALSTGSRINSASTDSIQSALQNVNEYFFKVASQVAQLEYDIDILKKYPQKK